MLEPLGIFICISTEGKSIFISIFTFTGKGGSRPHVAMQLHRERSQPRASQKGTPGQKHG